MIFPVSRVKQEREFTGMQGTLRASLVRTGGVVSSAGLILAAPFVVLMAQPIRELHQSGLAMSPGILFDTCIVRPIGDCALWPVSPAEKSPS